MTPASPAAANPNANARPQRTARAPKHNARPDAPAQQLIHPISYFALAQADHRGVDGDDQVAVAGFLSALYGVFCGRAAAGQ